LALMIEVGQILFAFVTSYIQNRWVIRQFKRHKRDMFLTEIGENIQHHSKTQSGKLKPGVSGHNKKKNIDLGMMY